MIKNIVAVAYCFRYVTVNDANSYPHIAGGTDAYSARAVSLCRPDDGDDDDDDDDDVVDALFRGTVINAGV